MSALFRDLGDRFLGELPPDEIRRFLREIQKHGHELEIAEGEGVTIYAVGREAFLPAQYLGILLHRNEVPTLGSYVEIRGTRVRNFTQSSYADRRCLFVDDVYDEGSYDAIRQRLWELPSANGKRSKTVRGAAYVSASPDVVIKPYNLRGPLISVMKDVQDAISDVHRSATKQV